MSRKLGFCWLLMVLVVQILFGAQSIPVKVTGIGETVQLAIDNGLKQAIEVAVGMMVRSYTKMDSQLTVTATDIVEQTTFQEKILSFSKAYIQNYTVLQTTLQSGLYYAELECLVRQEALEGAMLRNGIGIRSFDGSKLLTMFEINTTTDVNAGEMILAIFEDFEVPHGLWAVSETQTEILASNSQTVNVRVKITLSPDIEKFKGFISELEEVLKQASPKSVTEKVKFDTVDIWKSMLLSSFISDTNYRNVLRIYTEAAKESLSFREYFFDDTIEMEKQVVDALQKIAVQKNSYDLQLTLYDNLNKNIFRKEHIQVSQNSLLLGKNTFGFAYTGQRGNQFFLLPGSLRIEPGKVKASLNVLTFSLELEIPRAVFAESKKIVVEILEN